MGSTNDVCLRLIIYGVMFILAFWCAAIAAPIMWRLEYDREHWPSTVCHVVEWRCCRISCGKSGCTYQPRWIVEYQTKTGPRTGSYYGKYDVWHRPRETAEDKMYDHPVNTSFPCQYDPNIADGYRYIAEPNQFNTEAYYIWTIVMYAIGIPVCVLPFIGYLFYLLIKKCSCSSISCDCDCMRRKRPNYSRTRGIAPPMAYSPPAPPVISPPVPVPEPPRPDPFAARPDVDIPVNPVLIPLADLSTEVKKEEVSGSGSESSNMPVY